MMARLLRIHGRVQGVGYRQAFESMALTLRLAGWVRNRHDGTVEALVEGPPEQIDQLLAWCRRGPPAASVTSVEVAEQPPTGLRDFQRLPTA